jgi:hypothetical protein
VVAAGDRIVGGTARRRLGGGVGDHHVLGRRRLITQQETKRPILKIFIAGSARGGRARLAGNLAALVAVWGPVGPWAVPGVPPGGPRRDFVS